MECLRSWCGALGNLAGSFTAKPDAKEQSTLRNSVEDFRQTMRASFSIFLLIATFIGKAQCHSQTLSADEIMQKLNSHCAEQSQMRLDKTAKYVRYEALYSLKINTCVQIEIQKGGEYWSYDLFDLTNGFMAPAKLKKLKARPSVFVHNGDDYGFANAEGYWESTDTNPDKHLVSDVAVKISCSKDEQLCREIQASLFMGVLKPDSVEYTITSWTKQGILGDDDDPSSYCGVGHRLSIDFVSKSVTVTDYPKKVSSDPNCKAYQSPSTYSLQGGTLMIYGNNLLFSCSKDGVNSAILAKVREYHGDVGEKNYPLWMDDGEGGPPATVKKPSHPYTQTDCEKALQKKLNELKP